MSDSVKKIRSLKDLLRAGELNVKITVKDIIYAGICYMMSLCSVLDGRSPFALSALGAAFGGGKWGICLLVGIMGTLRFRFGYNSLSYIVSMIMASVLMKTLRGKTWLRAFFCSCTLFLVLLCRNIITDFAMDTFIIDLVEVFLCYGGVFVFDSAVRLIANAKERTCVSDTEIVFLLIFFALAIRCTVSFPLVFGFDVAVVSSIVLLLMLNLKGELSTGATMGIVFGIVTCNADSGTPSAIGAFALASLCSGALKSFGKWGVVLGFVIANTALVVFFPGEALPYDIFEIVLASILFAVMPQRVTGFISSFSAKTVHVPGRVYLEKDKIQKVISEKLDDLSEAYKKLALSYNRCFENKNMSGDYIIHMLDTASSKICPGCGLKYNCWERCYKESYKAMLSMLEIAGEKGRVTASDVPEPLGDKCIKLNEFVDSFNRMYEIYKVDKLWQDRLNESRMLVSSQLDGVSRSVQKLAAEFDMCLDVAAEKELMTRLDAGGIDFADVTFLKGRDESFTIDITLEKSSLTVSENNVIRSAVKEITGCNCSVTSMRHSGKGTVFTFKASSKYEVSVGRAMTMRKGEKVCGDSYVVCENSYGEFVAAISDGMGTGKKASEESVNAVELLKNFMSAGMDVETALELINSALLLRSSGDSFATMDVCVVNVFMGHLCFYKSGAAPGYIKNECGVSKICSDSLPFGVLSDYGKIKTEMFSVDKSALVVMMSDGMSDLFHSDGKDTIKQIIENTNTDNPQIIASGLMNEAMKLCGKKPDDDITVQVLSVKKVS